MNQAKYFNSPSPLLLSQLLTLLAVLQIIWPLDTHAIEPSTRLVIWSNRGTNVPSGLTNVVKISSGFFFDLAIRADGTVAQLGGPGTPPVGLSNVVAVAAGWDHSLAATADGSVVAWGSEYSGGATNVPPGLTNVVDVGCGHYNSAALRADGTVVAWGNNDHGQTNVPPGLSNVVSITIGYSFGLALRADGTVAGWGTRYYGSLPLEIPSGLSNVVSITGGNGHFLALHADGSLTAWGENWAGQTNIPTDLTNVVAVAAPASTAGDHNLVLRDDGTVSVWGCDCHGATTVPPGLSNVVAIAAGSNGDGSDYNLALVADGPFFTSPRLQISLSNGVATIALQGEANRRYVLEATSSLDDPANWMFEKNVRLTSTAQIIHQAPTSQVRFYRARQLH